jgi:hypothetical protein
MREALEEPPEDFEFTKAELDRLTSDSECLEQLEYSAAPGEDLRAQLVTWRKQTESRVAQAGELTGSGALAASRQAAIAREVEEGDVLRLREAERPGQHYGYTVAEYRTEFLDGELIEYGQIPDWVLKEVGEGGRETLDYPHEGQVVSVGYDRRNPRLARLVDLSDAISREYGWPPAEAVGFILSGAIPAPRKPVQVYAEGERAPLARKIVLEVDPYATAEEVAEAYVNYRRDRFESRVRRPDEDHLLLSLQEYPARKKELGTWRQRMEHWNLLVEEKGSGEWRFDDVKRFRAQAVAMSEPLRDLWRDDPSNPELLR